MKEKPSHNIWLSASYMIVKFFGLCYAVSREHLGGYKFWVSFIIVLWHHSCQLPQWWCTFTFNTKIYQDLWKHLIISEDKILLILISVFSSHFWIWLFCKKFSLSQITSSTIIGDVLIIVFILESLNLLCMHLQNNST